MMYAALCCLLIPAAGYHERTKTPFDDTVWAYRATNAKTRAEITFYKDGTYFEHFAAVENDFESFEEDEKDSASCWGEWSYDKKSNTLRLRQTNPKPDWFIRWEIRLKERRTSGCVPITLVVVTRQVHSSIMSQEFLRLNTKPRKRARR